MLYFLQMSLTQHSSVYEFIWKNLHRLPEVRNRDSHGAIFVNVPKEIPQA